jgi:hypothetical protein
MVNAPIRLADQLPQKRRVFVFHGQLKVAASRPPFGYRNIRINGRGLVEIHPENARKVRHIFELYAYHNNTLDTLAATLLADGTTYSPLKPEFGRSKLYGILTDRAYIGEVKHKGQWHPGKQEPLVDRATWDRVQFLLGQSIYRSHEMTYASELIECGHCGCPITGETKTKKTKSGEREYVYYRCTKYHRGDHPRIRLTEAEIDVQMLALFDKLRVEDDDFRHLFREELRKTTNWDLAGSSKDDDTLKKRHSEVVRLQGHLLNLRLLEEIDADTYAAKAQELRDEAATLRLKIERCDRNRHETIDIAVKAFELSQNLRTKWFAADYSAKRRILEIVCLNWNLIGVSLVPEMRKPFDLVAEGLLQKDSRGERI